MVILSILGNLIGNLFGGDGLIEDDSVTPCFQPGVLLDSGILWVQVKCHSLFYFKLKKAEYEKSDFIPIVTLFIYNFVFQT